MVSGPTDQRMQPRVINFSRPRFVRDVMVQNGDAHKPIWISEMNWNAVPDDVDPRYGRVSLEQQAAICPLAYQRIQAEWPWLGVANTWYLKRATDVWEQNRQPEAYFRLLAPDFTPQPVYAEHAGSTQGGKSEEWGKTKNKNFQFSIFNFSAPGPGRLPPPPRPHRLQPVERRGQHLGADGSAASPEICQAPPRTSTRRAIHWLLKLWSLPFRRASPFALRGFSAWRALTVVIRLRRCQNLIQPHARIRQPSPRPCGSAPEIRRPAGSLLPAPL